VRLQDTFTGLNLSFLKLRSFVLIGLKIQKYPPYDMTHFAKIKKGTNSAMAQKGK